MPAGYENRASTQDPRTRLVKEKYFSLRPKPLERWLWKQRVPQATERVFWLHWEEGMRNRDWCSQVAIRTVAAQCCMDSSTVTRAYQLLKSLGLIRREDPGRDPLNPFQQATAVTEVLIPRELLATLSATPNRISINKLPVDLPTSEPRCARPIPSPISASVAVASAAHPSRQQLQAIWERASAAEKSRYFNASRAGIANMTFDAATQLTQQDQSQWLTQLQQMALARNAPPPTSQSVHPTSANAPSPIRRLSLFTLARARQQIAQLVAPGGAQEMLRQVVWAIEEGALRRFEIPLALNIALKKIRQQGWTRPHRMPPNWARLSAVAETCNAA